MPVFSKPLVLAVTAASQRELFQAPLAARPQAFLAPAQPALVPMVSAPVDVIYPAAAGFSEQVYFVEEAAAPDAQSSWVGWSAIAAAAVAGVAIGRATAEEPAMLSVSGQEAPAAPARTSRRELIARAAAAAPLVAAALPAFAAEVGAGLQPNKRTEEVAGGGGATGGQGFSLVSTKGAAASAGRGGGQIPTIRAAGTWNDPAHPGCTRKIKLAGKTAFITGADEDGKKWAVRGEIKGDSLVIDFTPKGGPKDVEAKYVLGKGLVFPDGNVWSKA